MMAPRPRSLELDGPVVPIEGENFAMVKATDSALKVRAIRVYIAVAIGVVSCVVDTGCSQTRSSRTRSTPLMLGAAAPFSKPRKSPITHDLYAQEVGRGISHSRTLLAQDRARAEQRSRMSDELNGRSRSELPDRAPLQVALQPPETLQPGELRYQTAPAPALAQAGAPTPGLAPGSLPEPTPTPEPVQLPAQASNGEEVSPEPEPATSPELGAGSALASTDLPPMNAPEGELDLKANAPLPAADPSDDLSRIVMEANAKIASLTSYQVLMQRQERVGDALGTEEEVLLSVRRNPRAVRLEWPDGPNKGREVLYSAEQDPKQMHVRMPESIVPVPPISMAVDSPMVMRSSRHPITEAGFDTILNDLQKNVDQLHAADPSVGKMSYKGLDHPGQLEQPAHKIERITPNGETWYVFIDQTSKLPVMVEGTNANGDLLERYVFGPATIDPEPLAVADAFDPASRWGKAPSGLLSKLARVGAGKEPEEPETQTR